MTARPGASRAWSLPSSSAARAAVRTATASSRQCASASSRSAGLMSARWWRLRSASAATAAVNGSGASRSAGVKDTPPVWRAPTGPRAPARGRGGQRHAVGPGSCGSLRWGVAERLLPALLRPHRAHAGRLVEPRGAGVLALDRELGDLEPRLAQRRERVQQQRAAEAAPAGPLGDRERVDVADVTLPALAQRRAGEAVGVFGEQP